MFVRVEKSLKERLDEETKQKKTSIAKLMDAILRQHFEEKTNGKNATATRQTG